MGTLAALSLTPILFQRFFQQRVLLCHSSSASSSIAFCSGSHGCHTVSTTASARVHLISVGYRQHVVYQHQFECSIPTMCQYLHVSCINASPWQSSVIAVRLLLTSLFNLRRFVHHITWIFLLTQITKCRRRTCLYLRDRARGSCIL